MEDLEARLREALAPHSTVLVAYLFGSEARGTAGPLSDLDVAVLLAEDGDRFDQQLRLMSELSKATGRDDVEVVVLNEAPVELGYRVLRDGRLILCRDERARVRHFTETVDRYLDMEPFRRVQAEGLHHRLTEGRFGRP